MDFLLVLDLGVLKGIVRLDDNLEVTDFHIDYHVFKKSKLKVKGGLLIWRWKIKRTVISY